MRLPDRPPMPAAQRSGRLRLRLSVEQLVLLASLFWLLSANAGFFSAALKTRAFTQSGDWLYALGLVVLLPVFHALGLLLLATARTVKPLIALFTLASALGIYALEYHGAVPEPHLLQQWLHTGAGPLPKEGLSWALLPCLLLYAGLPIFLIWQVELIRPQARRAALQIRLRWLLALAALGAGALWLVRQPLQLQLQEQPQLLYLMAPGTYLWSVEQVLAAEWGLHGVAAAH